MLEALAGAVLAIFAIRAAVAVRRLHMDVVHHHGLVHLRKEIHAADGQRADGLAMIALRQAHEALLLGLARLVVELEAHLERGFDRRRAVVVEMELVDAVWRDLCEALGELDGRTVREIRKDDVLEAVELLLDGLVDLGIAMAEQVRPPRTHDVEVLLAVDVIEPRAFRMVNDHRRQRLVVLHLRTRMPDMREVALFPRCLLFFRHVDCSPLHL